MISTLSRGVWPVVALASILTLMSFAPARADVIYQYSSGVLYDGAAGPIARLQAAARLAQATCGQTETIAADGRFGRGTRDGLAALAKCPQFAAALSDDPAAKAGAMTDRYWSLLLREPPPGVDQRARTLLLTHEATDYTHLEWNYCQSRPLYDPTSPGSVCYSNDPTSYLTWGPNGATAGGGREVQLILGAVDAADSAIIDQAFGAEAEALRRTFVLPNGRPARILETYLCGVWADRRRREAWRAGFASVGRLAAVQETFDRLYRSSNLDGGKIQIFVQAYKAAGRTPTEIDYGFFKDRAAQTTVRAGPIRTAITKLLTSDPNAPAWKLRQAIAREVRPSGSMRGDRLARDVVFYIDGSGLAGLNGEEATAWRSRSNLRATDTGLSDERTYSFTPDPAFPTRPLNGVLTSREREACPQVVLDTRMPR